MKKFLILLILFLSPIIMIAYFADLYISQNLRKSNSFATKEYSTWNAILDGTVKSDIVVYGSSRAWVHFDSQMLEDSLHLSTYNLGIDGHNFWLQKLRHDLLLEKRANPSLIIQSLDDHTLSKRADLYNLEQFLPYMLWNTKIRKATMDYEGYNIYDYYIPLLRYYGKLSVFKEIVRLKRKPTENAPERIKGFQSSEEKWNFNEKIKSFDIEFDDASICLFENFLLDCKSNNIKVVLVYSPEQIEGQKLVRNRKKLIDLYRKYSQKYHIPFYDYSESNLSLKKDYFYNAMHLNATGSKLFTADLIQKLQNDSYVKPLILSNLKK